MTIQRNLWVACVLLTLAWFSAACSGLGGEPQVVATIPPQAFQQAPPTTQNIAIPNTEPDLGRAAQVYAENCVRCHGIGGAGDGEFVQNGSIPMLINFTDATQTAGKTAEGYYEVITNGRLEKLMPPWKDSLSDADRWSLAVYLISLSGTLVQPATTPDPIPAGAADGSNDNQPAQTAKPTESTVTVSADDSQITINGVVTQVDVTDGGLQVFQLVSYVNNAETAFLTQNAAGEAISVSWRLPANAAYIDMGNGLITKTDDTGLQVFDTQPVAPRQSHLLHLIYTLPFSEERQVSQTLDYPLAGKVEVLIGSVDLVVKDDTFTANGVQHFSDSAYMSYTAELNRAKGETVSYTLRAELNPQMAAAIAPPTTLQSQPTTQPSTVNPLAYVMIGFGLGSIGLAGVLYLRERLVGARSTPSAATVPAPTVSTTHNAENEEIQMLMKQIADLDIQHQQGKLRKAQYEQQRSALKAKLTRLMKAQGK